MVQCTVGSFKFFFLFLGLIWCLPLPSYPFQISETMSCAKMHSTNSYLKISFVFHNFIRCLLWSLTENEFGCLSLRSFYERRKNFQKTRPYIQISVEPGGAIQCFCVMANLDCHAISYCE